MDKNEFWALTGSSMQGDIVSDSMVKTKDDKDCIVKAKNFSVVIVEHDRGRSFREFEFLKSCVR